jgi:hypothetical protein
MGKKSKHGIKWLFDILGYISALDWTARYIVIGLPGASSMISLIVSWATKIPLYYAIPLAIFLFLLVLGLVTKFWHLKRKEVNLITPSSEDTITDELGGLLEFYERQKANWKSNLQLHLIRISPNIDGDVPKVVFEFEMINYLPVECKLIKVIHSTGVVSAGGSCTLPMLPETIDETINACSEKQFKMEMEVGRTKLPDFLRSKLTESGRMLQWTIKGEWYVDIYGKPELWQSLAYEIRCDQVIVRSYVIQERGM